MVGGVTAGHCQGWQSLPLFIEVIPIEVIVSDTGRKNWRTGQQAQLMSHQGRPNYTIHAVHESDANFAVVLVMQIDPVATTGLHPTGIPTPINFKGCMGMRHRFNVGKNILRDL